MATNSYQAAASTDGLLHFLEAENLRQLRWQVDSLLAGDEPSADQIDTLRQRHIYGDAVAHVVRLLRGVIGSINDPVESLHIANRSYTASLKLWRFAAAFGAARSGTRAGKQSVQLTLNDLRTVARGDDLKVGKRIHRSSAERVARARCTLAALGEIPWPRMSRDERAAALLARMVLGG